MRHEILASLTDFRPVGRKAQSPELSQEPFFWTKEHSAEFTKLN